MGNTLKSLGVEILNFLNHQPHPDHNFNSVNPEIDLKDIDVYKSVVSRISSSKGFIFLIGPWGSGKSTLVKQIIKNEGQSFSFTKRSFFGVSNETTAKLVAFTFCERLAVTAVTAYLFFRSYFIFQWDKAPPNSIIIEALVILSLLALADAPRITYLIGHAIAAFYRFIIDLLDLNVSKRVLLLEDLDRSSLSHQQLFGFLSNYPILRRTIVVPLGYNSENDQLQLLEYAKKLTPDVIEMPSKEGVIFQIVKSQYPEFPFSNSGAWMKCFSTRYLLSICYDYDLKTRGSKLHFKRLVMIRIKDEIAKLIKTDSKLDTEVGFEYRHSSIHLVRPHGATLTPHEVEVIQSFGLSFDGIALRYLIHQIASDEDRKRGHDWPTRIFEDYLDETKSKTIIERMQKHIQAT